MVALPVSAWIEIFPAFVKRSLFLAVALPVSAWIEILPFSSYPCAFSCRTPRECVD